MKSRRQADAIEITKAMTQAGLNVLNDSGLLEYETDSNSVIVQKIISKALRAGGFSVENRAGV